MASRETIGRSYASATPASRAVRAGSGKSITDVNGTEIPWRSRAASNPGTMTLSVLPPWSRSASLDVEIMSRRNKRWASGESRIGLIGDNAAGKSSILRMICGLILPDAGAVFVHGRDTRRDRRRFPGLVGIMFQNPEDQIIFPTVIEELEARLPAQAFLTAHGPT
jgi:ABC transporter